VLLICILTLPFAAATYFADPVSVSGRLQTPLYTVGMIFLLRENKQGAARSAPF